jgi:hypothetical protein
MSARIFRLGRRESLLTTWGEYQDMIAALNEAGRNAREEV